MPKSRITSPSRSERATVTPRRNQPRSSRSMGSPACSTTSARLSNIVDKFKEDHKDSFAVSPLSKTVLSDNTEIEMPRRKSWWRKVENSRDLIEVLESEKQANPTNVLEEFDVEVLSQEKNNYTMDMPESSGSESINSIVLPQRKLFTQKENVPQKKFGQVITNRASLGKHNKTNFNDKTVDIGPKNLFAQTSKRPKPVFPSALINMSLDKTANKTKEAPTEVKGQPKALFGNRLGTKRKNMFADFIVSESEDEIPDIQPKLFAFHKPSEPTRRSSVASRGFRDPSPTSSIITDTEMDDWKLLPSSTMVEHQLQVDLATPGKKARLSKLSEAKESTKDTTKQSDQTTVSKNKSSVANPDLESAHKENTRETTVRHEGNDQEKMELETDDIITNQEHSEGHEPDEEVSNDEIEDNEHDEINTEEQDKAEASQEIEAEEQMDAEQLCGKVNLPTPEKKARLSKISEAKESSKDTNKQSDQTKSSINKSGNEKFNADFSLEKVVASPDSESAHKEDTKETAVRQPHASVIEEIVHEKVELEPNEININQKQSEAHKPKDEVSTDEIEDSEHNQINTAEQDKAEASQEIEAEEQTDAEQELDDDDEQIEISKDKLQEQNYQDKEQKNMPDDEKESTEDEEEEKYQIESDNEREMSQEIEQQSGDEQNEEEDEENIKQDGINDQVHDDVESDVEDLQVNEQPTIVTHKEQEEVHASEDDAKDESENEQEQVEASENDAEHDSGDEPMHASADDTENDSGDELEPMQASADDAENDSGDELEPMQASADDAENDSGDKPMQASADDAENDSGDEPMQASADDAENDSGDELEPMLASADDAENESENEMEQEEIQVSNDEIERENEDYMNESQDDEHIESQDQVHSDQEIESDENGEINASDEVNDNDQEVEMQVEAEQEPSEVTTNNHDTHDTTGRNRKKWLTETPEAVLHEVSPAEEDSFTTKGRNTSIRKTKSILKNFSIRPSMAPPRESTGLSDGTKNSSAEGSGWDSHRTTRKTLRQTFGRDFTPRKSLRALVMEKSAKRQTMINEANAKLHQANSTELQDDNQDFGMEVDENVDPIESDHEVSRRTRQTTLEMYLQKIKKENMERKQKIEEQVKNSLKTNAVRVDVLNFRMPARPAIRRMKPLQSAPKVKRLKPSVIPLEDLPSDLVEDMKYKPPKRFRPSNASWITKRLYKFLEIKLEPKYDYKARIRAEKLVETIYNFVRDIRRLKVAPPHSVTELKREMARLDVVSTHFEFYNFFNDYLPSEIKVKVVPDIVNDIPLPHEGVFAPILV